MIFVSLIDRGDMDGPSDWSTPVVGLTTPNGPRIQQYGWRLFSIDITRQAETTVFGGVDIAWAVYGLLTGGAERDQVELLLPCALNCAVAGNGHPGDVGRRVGELARHCCRRYRISK
jgi:hypothetical protein